MLKLILIFSIVIFYISLFIELYVYSIPSVVLTKKILKPDPSITTYFSDSIKTYLNWPLWLKLLVFVVPMVFIYILHLLPAYILFDVTVRGNAIESTNMMCIIGISLVIIGRIISHLYLINIKKITTTAFNDFVTGGLFNFSRNPGLLGLYVSFLGFYFIQPSILFLVCYFIYIIHMHFKIKMEEDYLTNKHGDDYYIYLQKTRRYL